MNLTSSRRVAAIRPNLLIVLGILVLAGIVAGIMLLRKSGEVPSGESSSFTISQRPKAKGQLFDYAGLLRLQNEWAEGYLKAIRDNQKIEALIVTLPSLKGFRTVQEAAAKIMTGWKIGDEYGNKGILLLLAEKEKEVKMEVTYELEDVFTDLFTGAMEEKQLKSHMRAGDVASGMVAVIEEMENRAEIKHLGSYTPKMIADLDAQYASGGAGARKNLGGYGRVNQKDVAASILSPGSSIFTDSTLLALGEKKDPRFPAGRTPQEAWDTMRAAFCATKDTRGCEQLKKNAEMPYEILQTEDRAVISFGNKEGWDYAPFLFAKFPDGWKFDMVNQGLYVRYGNAPYWAIERGDHDYMDLLGKFRGWMDIDIPWEERDIYRVEQDSQLVAEILRLEELYRNNPDDFDTALELGRLGVITGRRLNLVVPRLEKAKSLRPDDPAPYKYLAIDYVTFSFQYKKAIVLMEEMLKRDPGSLFGRKFLGYVYFQAGDSISAEKNLRAALEIAPSDCYAATTLARVFAKRINEGGTPDDRRVAVELFFKSRRACAQNEKRVLWLKGVMIRLPQSPTRFGTSYYRYNYNGQGIVAFNIQPGSPAERAGLQEGDFILSLNGVPIFDEYEFLIFFVDHNPGDIVQCVIVRGALKESISLGDVTVNPQTRGLNPPKRMTLEVTLGRKDGLP